MEKQAVGAGAQRLKPRSYADEYRRQVADMVTSTGRTAISVAGELAATSTPFAAEFADGASTTP